MYRVDMFPVLPSSLRVLVATANAELERCLTGFLRDLRCSPEAVRNGADALRVLLGANPPEIALIDSILPDQDGVEVAAECKRRSIKKQTWVMLLTSAPDPAIVSGAADAGVDDLLLSTTGASAGDLFSPTDLRLRLSVAERVQQLTRQFEAQVQAVSFHSLHDNLTGLWNRESLLSLIFPETDRVQRMGTPLSFLLLDLDHFARINGEYGYETGDKILQEFAERLRRYMRSDDLIGRCGEDEFLMALPGCTSTEALKLAARIRTSVLTRSFQIDRDMITVTASIGVAQSRGRSPLVVLREAERALTYAKRAGRNCEREYIPLQRKDPSCEMPCPEDNSAVQLVARGSRS